MILYLLCDVSVNSTNKQIVYPAAILFLIIYFNQSKPTNVNNPGNFNSVAILSNLHFL